MQKIFLFVFSVGLCFLTSCFKKEHSADVLVSIPPYLYFIQELTGKELSAVSLVPVGANPHLYEPTPKQVEQAKSAKVWIRLSENFEKKVAKSLQEQNKQLVILNLAETIPLLPMQNDGECCNCTHCVETESKDLHIWLSLRLAQTQAKEIADALIRAFPQKRDLIEMNLIKLQEKLVEADELFTKKLVPFQGEALLVSHPAFGYFCHDYGLKQISIEYDGKDPLPQQLADILKMTENTKVRTVLTQAQYNNKGAEIIARKLHLPIHEVDPYSPDYLSNFRHIVHLVAEP
jgi:zinc transport system substrate-binding protein